MKKEQSKNYITYQNVNVNMELDKNVNLGIGQFVPILFSLIDIINLSFLKIVRS